MNEEDEKKDSEEELKEELERYERQNQEAYDEEVYHNEELRRKQEKDAEEEESDPTTDKLESRGYKGNRKSARQRQQEIRQRALADRDKEGNTVTRGPGQVFTGGQDTIEVPDRDMRTGEIIPNEQEQDQFGNPRLAASITTEIGLNLLLDVFSAAPPVQAVGSAWINYLAQKIRGETDINKLEMTAASIASQIPLLGSFKGATKAGKFGKGVLQGSVTGAIEETGYSLGRGEEANIPEAALFGATVGGIFNARNAPDFFDSIKGKLTKNTPLVTPEGMTFEPPTAFAMGGPGSGRKKKIKPNPDQLGFFENEGDEFLYEKYKAQNKVIGTPLPKRQQAGRALRPTDFDDIVAEDPNITPDLIFSYIESTKAGRFGKGVRNPDTKRFKRNNRGLEGTLRFLNQKAAPDADFNLSEIAAELSAEFNKTITPKTISNIIDENVDQGTFTFQTQGMSKPIEIKSIADLRTAYMGRVARYKNIPAFERGHVFAADNIIKDGKVKNLTDFKNNLEPEIARSIYAQLDNEAIEELIQANVDNNFESIESLYKSILDGNRSRKNLADPDKVIAALYGRDYGLRESFLNFVYPNRSLGRLIPADLKAAFTDLYEKELEMKLLNYKGLSVGPAALDKIRAEVARDVLNSFPDVDTRFVLEQMTLASDKGFGRDMVNQLTGEAK